MTIMGEKGRKVQRDYTGFAFDEPEGALETLGFKKKSRERPKYKKQQTEDNLLLSRKERRTLNQPDNEMKFDF